MRFLNMLFGGLVGAVPGWVISGLGGENLNVVLGGLLLVPIGFIVGAVVGWRRSGWLNAQGALGAVIGLIPGVILWQFDWDVRIAIDDPVNVLHWKGIVGFILIAGFLLGLFVGNRIGRRTTSTGPVASTHHPV
jgi:hypothetical protein